MNELQRFMNCLDYKPVDCCPNHELGVWPQTVERWRHEDPAAIEAFAWNWFVAEDPIHLDRREYIPVNYDFIPHFGWEVLEETPEYEIVRNHKGIVTKGLKEGTVGGGRMCMDQYLEFPVRNPEDFSQIKKRLVAAIPERYPADLDNQISTWKKRDFPLVLGTNCAANGFFWRAREFMGTEALSYAWYDMPDMMHDMMEFYADFIIETSRPVLEKINVEYFVLNEDLSMKTGPLLSPETYRKFVLKHLKRLVEFMKSHGVRYIAVDTDGDPTPLIPMFLEGGVDILWPLERASNVDPNRIRALFGTDLRLWGGVDKRVLPHGREAIRSHLLAMAPLIEEGGFIPTIDHTVPPDVSWDNFRDYMDLKMMLLSGDLK